MEVSFTRAFFKRLNRYQEEFKEIVLEKIEDFKNPKNHEHLRVHKLHGKFSKFYSFSINYKTRVVFEYVSKKEVVLLSIGDHDIYN